MLRCIFPGGLVRRWSQPTADSEANISRNGSADSTICAPVGDWSVRNARLWNCVNRPYQGDQVMCRLLGS